MKTVVEQPKMGRVRRSWLLTKGAWQALKLDKELISLPLIGFLLSLPLFGAIVGLVASNPDAYIMQATSENGAEGTITPLAYVILFAVFAVITVISTMISGAVAHGALERFRGNDPSVKSSLRAAWKRRGSLAGFALFSYGIGTILSEIASRIPFLGGKIVAWLAQAAWSVASFFAIPVIMSSQEPVSPLKATKRSIGIIKQVWGESLVVSFSIGIIGALSFIIYWLGFTALTIAGAAIGLGGWFFAALGVVSVIGLIGFILIFTMLDAFARVAIYYYAETGTAPETFNKELLKAAFTPKKARKLFS